MVKRNRKLVLRGRQPVPAHGRDVYMIKDSFGASHTAAREALWKQVSTCSNASAARRLVEALLHADNLLGRVAKLSNAKGAVKSGKWCVLASLSETPCTCCQQREEQECLCEDHAALIRICTQIFSAPVPLKLRQAASAVLQACLEKHPSLEKVLAEQVKVCVAALCALDNPTEKLDVALGLRNFVLSNPCRDLVVAHVDPGMIFRTLHSLQKELNAPALVSGPDTVLDASVALANAEIPVQALMEYLQAPGASDRIAAASPEDQEVVRQFAKECLFPWVKTAADSDAASATKSIEMFAGISVVRLDLALCTPAQIRRAIIKLCKVTSGHQALQEMSPVNQDNQQVEITHSDELRSLVEMLALSCTEPAAALLLRNLLACVPRSMLFGSDAGDSSGDSKVSDQIYVKLMSISEAHVFNATVQGYCLTGLEAWCKTFKHGLRELEDDALVLWQDHGRQRCLELLDFVLDNWSQGSRKARYYLEPLFNASLEVLEAIAFANSASLSDSFAAERDIAVEARGKLLRRLLQEVTLHNPGSQTTNLRAALLAVGRFLEHDGARGILQIEPDLMPALLRCFEEHGQVYTVSTKLFRDIASNLEKNEGLNARQVWLAPLLDALTKGDTNAAEQVATRIVPELLLSVNGVTCATLQEALEERQPTLEDKLRLWGALSSAGLRVEFVPDMENQTIPANTSTSSKDVSDQDVSMAEANDDVTDGTSAAAGISTSTKEVRIPSSAVRQGLQHADALVQLRAAKLVLCPTKKQRMPSAEVLKLARVAYSHTVHKSMSESCAQGMRRSSQLFFEWIGIAMTQSKRAAEQNVSDQDRERVLEFLVWFKRTMIEQIYPDMPRERASTVLSHLLLMLEVFASSPEVCTLEHKDHTFTLLSLIRDVHEQPRTMVLEVMRRVPAPFPGLESWDSVHRLVKWAVRLAKSHKVRNARGGSALLQVLYEKYVLGAGWAIGLRGEPTSRHDPAVQGRLDFARMHLSCAEAFKCERAEKAYNVGSIIVREEDQTILARGFSREMPGNTHAEETAFMKIGGFAEKAEDIDDIAKGGAKNTTIYTTMEPCSVRLSGNRPCTSRCISAGVKRVVVGVREPSKFVECTGTRELREAGIRVDYLTGDQKLRERCMEPNMFLFPDEGPVEPYQEDPNDDFEQEAVGKNMPRDVVARAFISDLIDSYRRPGAEECFGLLQAFRNCWEASETTLRRDPEAWAQVADDALSMLDNACETAAKAVCKTQNGGEDENEDDEGDGVPDNDMEQLSDDDDHNDDDNGDNADSDDLILMDRPMHNTENVIVNGWLVIREVTMSMETIVRTCPLELEADAFVLAAPRVDAIGVQQLQLLLRLRHMGAIGFVSNSFQGISARLLRLRRSPALSKLPMQWTNYLLHRLEDGRQGFYLRRSVGFASAFLALACAEPRAGRTILLERMATRLMYLAGNADDMRIRVHALNILKLLFEDGSLQHELQEYLPQLLLLSLRGFRLEAWQVRNSSMMVFARVIQRAFGQENMRVSRTVGASQINSAFFMQRYGDVFMAVLENMRRIVNEQRSGHKKIGGMDPSLYPMLLILSRLRPAFVSPEGEEDAFVGERKAEWEAGNKEVLPFLPLLLACASQPHVMARSMASRALASLCPEFRLLDTIREILAMLVNSCTSTPPRLGHNHTHGLLLHLWQLFVTIRERNLHAGPRARAAMLDLQLPLAEAMRAVLSTCGPIPMMHTAVWNSLWQFALLVPRENLSDAIFALAKEAGDSACETEDGVSLACRLLSPEVMATNLRSEDCRRRLAALIATKDVPSSSQDDQILQAVEYVTMNEQGVVYPPELIARMDFLASSEAKRSPEVGQRLLRMYSSQICSGEGSQSATVRALGAYAAQQPDIQSRLANIVYECSDPAQSFHLRLAALDALRSSCMLEICDPVLTHAWRALLVFAQDEVDALRQGALSMAVKHVPVLRAQPQCESLVIQSLLKHMHSVFTDVEWSELRNAAREQAVALHPDLNSLASSPGDLALFQERTFMIEPDNIYAEPLDLLRDVVHSEDTQKDIHGKSELGFDVEVLEKLVAETLWPGGVSFHHDAFAYLYRAALTCSPSQREQLKKILDPDGQATVHPVIRELLESGSPA